MKKTRRLFLSAFLLCGISFAASAAPYVINEKDFEITSIRVDSSMGIYVLSVGVYFRQPGAVTLIYPSVDLMLNEKGDTLGVGYNEIYFQYGQQTVEYHVNLVKKEIPDYSKCRFFYTATPDFADGSGDRFVNVQGCVLTYRSEIPAKVPRDVKPEMITVPMNRYLLKGTDFEITGIKPDSIGGQYGLDVFIYFRQSRTTALPYPFLGAVTDRHGDTLGTGFKEYFMQRGQDTVVYHLTLRKNEIPEFSNCVFYFGGPSLDMEKDDVCELFFDGKPKPAPVPVALDCSALKITGIGIYDPQVNFPEMEVAVYFNADHLKMLEAPYISCVKDASGHIIADGYKSHQQFYGQQGQDTLLYHLYFRKKKIPDLNGCTYYFCSAGKISGRDSVCVLTTSGAASVPTAPARKRRPGKKNQQLSVNGTAVQENRIAALSVL